MDSNIINTIYSYFDTNKQNLILVHGEGKSPKISLSMAMTCLNSVVYCIDPITRKKNYHINNLIISNDKLEVFMKNNNELIKSYNNICIIGKFSHAPLKHLFTKRLLKHKNSMIFHIPCCGNKYNKNIESKSHTKEEIDTKLRPNKMFIYKIE
jgi:hypothetical protein